MATAPLQLSQSAPPQLSQAQHTWPHPSQSISAWPPLDPALIDRLDPIFVRFYNETISKSDPPSADIKVLRQNFTTLYRKESLNSPTGVGGIGESVAPGSQYEQEDIKIRIYVPPGEPPGQRLRWPVHFNFHSGAYAVGDLDTDAHLAHHICAQARCAVVDVAYRLIPEVPFGTGIMDALSAVRFVLLMKDTYMIEPDCFTLGGSSSGGSIALILNHLLRDAGYGDAIKGVIAGTPIISNLRKVATPSQSPWASVSEFQNAPLLDWQKMKFFDTLKCMSVKDLTPREQKTYVGWFGDLMSAPNFNGLARTFIATAEIDPLRDEAEGYAERMREEGNDVVVKRYPAVPHQFMYFDKILPQGREYVEDVINHVSEFLRPPVTQQLPANQPENQMTQNASSHPQQQDQAQLQNHILPSNATDTHSTDDVLMSNEIGL